MRRPGCVRLHRLAERRQREPLPVGLGLQNAEPRQQPHQPMERGRERARLLRELRRAAGSGRELVGQAEFRGGVERPRHPVAEPHLDDLGVRRRHVRGIRVVVSHESLRCEREKGRRLSRTPGVSLGSLTSGVWTRQARVPTPQEHTTASGCTRRPWGRRRPVLSRAGQLGDLADVAEVVERPFVQHLRQGDLADTPCAARCGRRRRPEDRGGTRC